MVGKLRDMRDQSRRVLILGSGPLAETLIEEIESAQNPRYIVAGTVVMRERHGSGLKTIRLRLPEDIGGSVDVLGEGPEVPILTRHDPRYLFSLLV